MAIKSMQVSFGKKQLKKIPRRVIFVWVILSLLLLVVLIEIFVPSYKKLEAAKEYEIVIDDLVAFEPNRPRTSALRLYITADDQLFYLYYPSLHYKEYRTQLESELLSGKVTIVKVKAVDRFTIWDMLSGRKRIVDLRSDNSVYYDLETEVTQSHRDHIGVVCAGILLLLLWLIDSVYILLVYGLIRLKPHTKA